MMQQKQHEALMERVGEGILQQAMREEKKLVVTLSM